MSEDKKKIEEYIQKYPSVRNWFLKPKGERRYQPTTEKSNLKCLNFWCLHLNKTPDELVPSDMEEAERNEAKIIGHLLIEGIMEEDKITQHTTKYHSFCLYNSFKFPRGGDRLAKVFRLVKKEL